MKRLCLLIVLVCGLWGTAFSQGMILTPTKGSKTSNLRPTVYLRLERRDKARLWLRMVNNTEWAVAVRTFTFYLNRQHSITLGNGKSVSALPSDVEISSLHYYVEKEPAASNQIKVPEIYHGDSSSVSWVAPKGSILFAVPAEQLEEGLMLYVPFQYEWELNHQLIFNSEPQHRVYFRGADLIENIGSRRR